MYNVCCAQFWYGSVQQLLCRSEKNQKTGKNREKDLNNKKQHGIVNNDYSTKIQQKMIKKVKRKKEMWGK